MDVDVTLEVDGIPRTLAVDVRATLLDALRERLGITTAKKGCDHGQCGSCTVILDDRRRLSCLTLAVANDGATVVTAAGLAALEDAGGDDDELHSVQRAFLKYDGLQCGYCTPGQVCSAVGMLDELKQGEPSHVTEDLEQVPELTDEEIRERMSGNLCRCGAYVGMLAAIREAGGQVSADDAADGGETDARGESEAATR